MTEKRDNSERQTENYPTSRRRCEIDGKRFLIVRHFTEDKDLNAAMLEIAVNRANRETDR